MADKSLITDLLKTPRQMREEREQQLLTEGLAQAQLFNQGNRLGGVGGMFAGFGASQAAQTGRDIDRAVSGVRSAASAATGKDFRRGEERVAAADQAIMKGVKTNDPDSLRKAAEKVSNPRAREAMLAKADQIEATRAASTSATQQQKIENAFKAREVAVKELEAAVNAGKSQAQVDKLQAEVNRITQLLPAELRTQAAQATSAEAKALVDEALVDTNIAQSMADLSLTENQNAQLQQSITQAAQKFPEELKGLQLSNLSTEASTALATAQANRTKALTPLEVKKIVEETNYLGYQQQATQALTEQRKAELKNVNSTDFLRELAAANLTPEEEQRLIKERLEARAATGGVSGFGQGVLNLRLEQLSGYINNGKDAQNSLERTENILAVMDNADVGALSSVSSFANYWLGAMGVEEAQQATAANELIQVMTGALTLDAASNLKGALSDKDLRFLQDTIPTKDMSPQGMRNLFTEMAAERYAEAEVAKEMDSYLASASEADIRKGTISTKANDYMSAAKRKYLLEKKKAGTYNGPVNLGMRGTK